MNRLQTLIFLLLSCSLSFTAFAKPPNIILVMTDDQGYAPVGAHGHPWIRTPHMDDMYQKSIRFDRFYMGSTCAPSRAGIMTGNHAIRNGVTHTILERERLNLKATTLPQVLKKAGYTSGVFGKWHLGDEDPYQPENRGFDEVFIHGAGGIGQKYKGSCADVPGNKYFDTVFKHNDKFVKSKGYCTDTLFLATLGWIQKVKEEQQPFFAYLSTNAPHSPFIAPPEYQQYFENLGFDPKPAGFYGMIEHVDENLGRMFEKLEEWDLMEDTIVIFTSDNGMTRGGCGLTGFDGRPQIELGKDKEGKPMMSYNAEMSGLKGTVHEGGVRAPFFVRWDGKFKEGRTIDTIASCLDILPTFAELAGIDLPGELKIEGRSLVPLMFEENPKWEDRYLFEHVTRWGLNENPDDYKWQKFSVRNQRYRLVENELFDMQKDPSQNRDIAADHPEIVNEMKDAYEAFWDEVRPLMINDGVPLSETHPFHEHYHKQNDSTGIPDWVPPTL